MFCDCTPGVPDLALDVAWGILPERCGVCGLLMGVSVVMARDEVFEGMGLKNRLDGYIWDCTVPRNQHLDAGCRVRRYTATISTSSFKAWDYHEAVETLYPDESNVGPAILTTNTPIWVDRRP